MPREIFSALALAAVTALPFYFKQLRLGPLIGTHANGQLERGVAELLRLIATPQSQSLN